MSRRKYNPQKAAMYAKRMTTADIESYMHELYDIDISDSTISRITDKILPIVKRAVYIALGINMNKKKDSVSSIKSAIQQSLFLIRMTAF